MKLLLATKDRDEVATLLSEVKDPRYLPHIKRIREMKEKYTPLGKRRVPKPMIIAHSNFISQLDISFRNSKGDLYYVNKLRLQIPKVDEALFSVLREKIIGQAGSLLTDTVKKNLCTSLSHLFTGDQLLESRAELSDILGMVSTMHLNLPDVLATLIGYAEAYETTVQEMANILQFDYPFDFEEIHEHNVVRFHVNGEPYVGACW
jgi:hypothetical protein